MEIYVDGILQTSWTSSGTTAGLENVDLGVIGQAIEVRGVLAGSEWLSIMEVCGGSLSSGQTGTPRSSVETHGSSCAAILLGCLKIYFMYSPCLDGMIPVLHTSKMQNMHADLLFLLESLRAIIR